MNIFVTDLGVAQTLARDAVWNACVLNGVDHDNAGCVVRGLGDLHGVCARVDDRAALDAYFGAFDGAWETVSSDQGAVSAYVTERDAAVFTDYALQVERLVAQDVVAMCAAPTGANQPVQRAGLVMSARSRVRAINSSAPVGVRAGFGAEDVMLSTRQLSYAKYFEMEDVTLRHKRFDGSVSAPILRSVLRAADAVTVLPYDPVLDQIVLVEQFRPGAYVRGDVHPWVLEPVAGRCDGDEPVEEVAEREMVEEAGLTLLSLERIGGYYPSPGCLSEYLYSFVGLVDLSDEQAGVHGLETENEDIRTHFLSFDDAMELISSGEADNGPLLLSLYWLAANRARLREAAGCA